MTQQTTQQELQQAILHERVEIIGHLVRRHEGIQNQPLPCGELPMVFAIHIGSIASYVELRNHEISGEQWSAAEDAAVNTTFASMVRRRQEMVPKPLGAT